MPPMVWYWHRPTAVTPLVPALIFGTAVWLLITLEAIFIGGLFRANPSLSGIVMLAGFLLSLLLGVFLARLTYLRNHPTGA
jgi:hypothetical protein